MKKKALVLAICMAISVPTISLAKSVPNDIGFNLGDIQSSSTVGQPFSGVIPVLFSSVDEASQLSIKIAPLSVFQKIGIDRLPFLDNLHFKIETQRNKPVVHISSSKPIEMPFIDFIIEVTSPKGVIYQDYTILIDPPNYSTAQPKSVKVQQVQALTKRAVTSSPKLLRGTMLNYEVLAGDKLTDIAAALKTSQNSLKRIIDIIHRTNPKAFVNNDIRQLKSGVFLKIPSANQISNFKFKTVNKTVKSSTKTQKDTIKIDVTDKSNEENTSVYTVKKGDTLSQITLKFTDKSISFTKRMHSIFNANPHAFSDNKINVLKIGSQLVIPYGNSDVEAIEKEFLINPAEQLAKDPINSPAAVKESKVTETTKPSTKKLVQKNVMTTVLNSENTVKKTSIVKNSTTAKSAETIKNLEKRVRELRNNLADSRSKLSQLEKILVTKNIELKKKSSVISSQKSDMTELKELLLENEENKIMEQEINQIEFNPAAPLKIKSTSIKPKALNNNNDSLASSLRDLSFDNVSLGFLALLLGLGLITYRKELYYTYAAATGDYPKYYPPAKQTEIASKDEEPEIELTTRMDEEVIISDDELQECNKLINEISNDLNTKENSATDNNEEWNNLEKICDDYIEKFKEDKNTTPVTDTNLDPIANEAALDNQESEVSFEDMVSDLISNLDDKSKFAEADDVISDIHDDIHDFGILVDTKKKDEKVKIKLI